MVSGRAIIGEMCKFLVSSVIATTLSAIGAPVLCLAQEAGTPKAAAKASPYSSLLGAVTTISSDGSKITLKPDTGDSTVVALDAKTHYMKVAPGEKDLKKASDVQFSEIGVGDRVLARVRKMDDGSVSPATTVVVMTKAAIAQHHERNQAEWQTRGVVGTVTLVNPATNEVTLKTQGADGKQIVVEPAEKVSVRKYAPNSVKFSDATVSSLADIKNGDTIRVLGTKNEDGSRVKPEEIIFGTFVRQAGTILAIDTVAGTVKMTDLATKKPVTVKIDESTSLKKLPPMMVQGLLMAQNGGRPGMGGPGAASPGAGGFGTGAPGSVGQDTRAARPNGQPGTQSGTQPGGASDSSARPGSGAPGGMRQGQGRPGGMDPSSGGSAGMNPGGGTNPGGMGAGGMGGRRMDPSKMMERMPTITLADLKAGDAIMVSSSGMKDGMISAISLVAGVELLLTAPAKPGQAAGPNTSWNFEMSIPQ